MNGITAIDTFAAMDTLLKNFLPDEVVEYSLNFIQSNEELKNLEGWKEVEQIFQQLNTILLLIATVALPLLLSGVAFLSDNLSIIGPLVLGFGGAFGVFKTAILLTSLAKKVKKRFSGKFLARWGSS